MMGTIRKFEDLIAWQEAHKLTLLIYKITEKFRYQRNITLFHNFDELWVSVESCIAEGFCRFHYKERLQFYFDARGSIGEIQSQIFDARDLKFVSEANFQKVITQSEQTGVVLGGLIRRIEKLSSRG